MRRLAVVAVALAWLVGVISLPMSAAAPANADTPADFSASPSSIDFGDVPLNTTVTESVTLTVDSGYGVYQSSGSDAPFSLDFGTCVGFTGPGTCTISVGFTPSSTGLSSGGYALHECPDVVCQTWNQVSISLLGDGVSVFAASPASVDFGDVTLGTTATASVTLTLDSGYYLVRGGGSVPGFGVGVASCGADSCSLEVTFAPTAVGPASDTITVQECAVGDSACAVNPLLGQTTDISVHGNGANPVADLGVAISAPSPVQNKKPVTFTITVRNDGPDAATGVIAANALPTASGLLRYSVSQGGCTSPPVGSTGTMVCSLGDLASNTTAAIKVTVTPTVKNNKLIQDSVTVSQDAVDLDPVQADNTAAVTVQVK